MEPRQHTLHDGRTLQLRQAEREDAAAVLQYLRITCVETNYFSFGEGEFKLSEAEEADELSRFKREDNRLYLVALLHGDIVGSINFLAGSRPRIRHSGELGMSVRKSCWRLGIGAFMLQALMEWARASPIVTKVNLRVRVDNAGAQALYKRFGFAVEGTILRDMFIDGRYYDHHWMGAIVA